MGKVGETIAGIFVAIITLATISVLISRRSRAPEAIQAVASGIANVVKAAVAPGNNGSY